MIQKMDYRDIKVFLMMLIFLLLIYIIIPLPAPLFRQDYSTVVTDRHGVILQVFLNREEQWLLPPAEPDSIPEKLKTCVLYFEDRNFYRHPGVNPFSILRALKQNISAGKTVSGASTISMQVARMLKPKSRTISHKLLEILQAFKLELRYSKDEILAAYLNHAPYGGNIQGYQAAAMKYFNKSGKALSWAEAATLAVLPNAPSLISPLRSKHKLKVKRDKLLDRLRQAGVLDSAGCQLAQLEPIPSSQFSIDPIAWHASQFLHARYPQHAILHSTLDAAIQQQSNHILQRQMQHLRQFGIKNGACLIADTRSGKILAYVGSADFRDSVHLGQVDGVRAPRSSGSVLKPFLYALSMDDGLILPDTQIKDVPTWYGAYSPANASMNYHGVITAREALILSLNVPAVRLLNAYGLEAFYNFLKNAGVSSLFRTATGYGLPLILGGSEISVWDVAMLYHSLGSGGVFSPLSLLENKESGTKKHFFSSGSAWLVLEILKQLQRPGNEYYWELYQNQWPIAWKTGTSYGQRDAWAAGVTPQWTIAVWVGNFTGEGNSHLSGAACAGPILFDLFNSLPKQESLAWFEKPDSSLQEISVCRETGFLAGIDCPHRVIVSAPRGMKPLRVCPWHTRIFTTKNGTEQVCSKCWGSDEHVQKSILQYSPDIREYLKRSGQYVATLPPHRTSCPSGKSENPLLFAYPQPNARIFLPKDFGSSNQPLVSKVHTASTTEELFWYLDDSFKGSTIRTHEFIFFPKQGWHTINVVDRMGNKATVKFYIIGPNT